MPNSAPDTTVAMSLSRRVGTPEASAAISSSRMVAKPMPSRERSIVRAVTSDATTRISISRNRYWMKAPSTGISDGGMI